MALPPSTANWHWKNKNITQWAKTWFERELTTVVVEEGDQIVSISEVTEVDGDVELGQRKSKLITIYDCKIDLKWTGKASDGSEVNGILSIPEVSHEITLDKLSNYVYNWTLSTSKSSPVEKLFQFAKSQLPVALETKFAEFPTAITEIHGKDLTVSAAPSQEPSRVGTPLPTATSTAPTTSTVSAATPSTVPKAVKKETKPVNTTTVTVSGTFMASAEDLYGIMTDEKRIPAWSRAAAQSDPTPGGKVSLFGGSINGSYVSLDKPKKVVQTWALSSPSWPSGHSADLVTTFDQVSDSTTLTLSLEGVPIGMEDEMRRNLEGYYLQGLKSIGYVQLILSPAPLSSTRTPVREPEYHLPAYARPTAILAILLALAATFILPVFR